MRCNYAKKQEVINLLNKGWKIWTRRNESFGKRNQLVYSSLTFTIEDEGYKNSRNVHSKTINSLKEQKIIGDHYKLNSNMT